MENAEHPAKLSAGGQWQIALAIFAELLTSQAQPDLATLLEYVEPEFVVCISFHQKTEVSFNTAINA